MSRFVNAVVVGVVALVVLSGAIFYFIQTSDSAEGRDDDGGTQEETNETTDESPTPTETTEPSPTNTTEPSPTNTTGSGNSTGNNTTSPSPAPDGNETGNQSGNGTSLSPWLFPPWRVAPLIPFASTFLWAAVEERPQVGGPRR